ncbi:universal stress protein [Blastococcus sp. BMG 814]|uniref:Universal stress protein n=1 Tax=Blastococcus carthaginiensis TaxID=3050034 RepID=A0ABT9IHC2_9ACTN|nr:universal stress protein [Blastococcus carthaginiensis]MDP5184985.1 universal stress protein [Blastococcus carthaginiensis]
MLSDAEHRTIEALEAGLLADRHFSRAVDLVARRLRPRAAPVVLGVGAAIPTGALVWAAAEAQRRRCPLQVVHAVRPSLTGAAVLDRAVALAETLAPDVDVSAHPAPGPVDQVLLQAGRTARLLVLGTREHAPRPGLGQALWRRPLAWRVAAAAHCPVAVVRTRPGGGAADAGCGIVVGVDGGPGSEAALLFALRCAQERRTSLTAVHAWTADRPADLEGMAAPVATSEAHAHRRAALAVERWRALCPDVPVVVDTVRGDPAAALVESAAGAALVVVGARRRGPTRAAVLGSVSRDLIQRGTAPVAVVPPAPVAGRTHLAARR